MTRPRDIADSINRINSSAADATAVTINSSENVGIGTATVSEVLHLHRASGTVAEKFTDDTSGTGTGDGFEIGKDSNQGGFIWNYENAATYFGTNNTERMRIDASGNLLIGANDVDPASTGAAANAGVGISGTGFVSVARTGGSAIRAGRIDSDGALIEFFGDGTAEGSISVSGTTVSYNGGHLSRWSQLTNGTKDTSIVKGTVMTNLDQMAVWSHDAVAASYYVDGDFLPEITPATYYTKDDTLPDGVSVGDEKTAAVYAKIGDEITPARDAYTEDNEQLNCMAVSSVEGDTNVAGVFVNWDNDDDDFNDINVGMTGDMVIRIAKGTTIARGDLLMSAGDGTAKPQDDDIVRSKTIAKVTSANVSHTYDDGSYLVPCVLMAC
jgi:hypothetical protein